MVMTQSRAHIIYAVWYGWEGLGGLGMDYQGFVYKRGGGGGIMIGSSNNSGGVVIGARV